MSLLNPTSDILNLLLVTVGSPSLSAEVIYDQSKSHYTIYSDISARSSDGEYDIRIDAFRNFASKLINESRNLNPDIYRVLNEEFWGLIDRD